MMKHNLLLCLLALTLVGMVIVPAAASPTAAAPCAPGAAYDPACDANQNGVIDVFDIQLTAGHWNQNGPFTSGSWDLTGNAGTNPATNYVGTTDNQPLVFKANGNTALRLLPGKDGEQDLRSVDGPARPGDYVAVTVLGAALVKVDPAVAVTVGQRLTVAETAGRARPLRTVQVEGVKLDESGPSLGVVLEPAGDGLVWALVNPQ